MFSDSWELYSDPLRFHLWFVLCVSVSATQSHIETVSLFMAACGSPSPVVLHDFSPPAECGDEANL